MKTHPSPLFPVGLLLIMFLPSIAIPSTLAVDVSHQAQVRVWYDSTLGKWLGDGTWNIVINYKNDTVWQMMQNISTYNFGNGANMLNLTSRYPLSGIAFPYTHTNGSRYWIYTAFQTYSPADRVQVWNFTILRQWNNTFAQTPPFITLSGTFPSVTVTVNTTMRGGLFETVRCSYAGVDRLLEAYNHTYGGLTWHGRSDLCYGYGYSELTPSPPPSPLTAVNNTINESLNYTWMQLALSSWQFINVNSTYKMFKLTYNNSFADPEATLALPNGADNVTVNGDILTFSLLAPVELGFTPFTLLEALIMTLSLTVVLRRVELRSRHSCRAVGTTRSA